MAWADDSYGHWGDTADDERRWGDADDDQRRWGDADDERDAMYFRRPQITLAPDTSGRYAHHQLPLGPHATHSPLGVPVSRGGGQFLLHFSRVSFAKMAI